MLCLLGFLQKPKIWQNCLVFHVEIYTGCDSDKSTRHTDEQRWQFVYFLWTAFKVLIKWYTGCWKAATAVIQTWGILLHNIRFSRGAIWSNSLVRFGWGFGTRFGRDLCGEYETDNHNQWFALIQLCHHCGQCHRPVEISFAGRFVPKTACPNIELLDSATIPEEIEII